MVLHKDSKWMAAWDNFKDNNQYVQSECTFFYNKRMQMTVKLNVLLRFTILLLFIGNILASFLLRMLVTTYNICRIEIKRNIKQFIYVSS